MLVIFEMDGVLSHVIHKKSLENKSLPRNLDIDTLVQRFILNA